MTEPTGRARADDAAAVGALGAELASGVEQVRSAITALRRHPSNRTGWPRTAAAASVRAARASAALDGAPLALDLDAASVADPVLAGALRVAAAIGSLSAVWTRAPMQALAKLHTLAAADLVPSDDLGRPRVAPGCRRKVGRSGRTGDSDRWPAPVQIALVHGELLAIAPFGVADGVVARAAARLTMISSGLDPAGLGVPEVAHLRSGPRYRELAAGYRTGAPAAVDEWIGEVCRCLVLGAREGVSIADSAAS